jgi:hypothetical protein
MKGIIEAVSEKKTKTGKDMYGILIEGKWVNGFGKLPNVQKGDTVEVEVLEKDGFRNVSSLRVITPGSEVKPAQTSLNTAVEGRNSPFPPELTPEEANYYIRLYEKCFELAKEVTPVEQDAAPEYLVASDFFKVVATPLVYLRERK